MAKPPARQPSQGGNRGRKSSSGGGRGAPSSRGRGETSKKGRGSGSLSSSGADRTSSKGGDNAPSGKKSRRRDLTGAAANLPNWVIEALARVTPDGRVAPALQALGEASEAFGEGAYRRAVRKAQQAKELAPRDTTIREVLGLAAYRAGDWQTALAELRTFRRLAGETTHLPVEMDALRAMERYDDVEAAWATLRSRGGKPAVLKEGAVVYASFLIDRGDLNQAWEIAGSGKTRPRPFEEDLRLWYVAARIAALRSDAAAASRLRNAILEEDPAFPGIDELEALISRA